MPISVLINSYIYGGGGGGGGPTEGYSLENQNQGTANNVDAISISVGSWGIQRGDVLVAFASADNPHNEHGFEVDGTNFQVLCRKGNAQPYGTLQVHLCDGSETTVGGTADTGSDAVVTILLHFRGIKFPRKKHLTWDFESTGMPRAPGSRDTTGAHSVWIFGALDDDNVTATAPTGYTLVEAAGYSNAGLISSAMCAYKDTSLSAIEDPAAFGGAGTDQWQGYTLNIYEETYPDNSGITPNLTLWLDGSDADTLYTDAGVTKVASDGDAVYQWNDKSGNGNNLTQATAASRPTYQTNERGGWYTLDNVLSVVRFDGTDDQMTIGSKDYSDFFGANTVHGFAVLAQDSTSTINPLVYHGSGSTNKFHLNTDDTGNVEFHFPNESGGSLSAATPSYWDDRIRLVEFWRDGANGDLLVSDTSIASSAALTGSASYTAQTFRLGSDGTDFFKGDLMELIIFDDALSAANQTAMVEYLRDKWLVQAGAFNPTHVGKCMVWMDASDSDTMFTDDRFTTKVASDGDTVAAWLDKAQNFVMHQKTATNEPTYKTAIYNSLSCLRFDGTNDALHARFEHDEEFTDPTECEMIAVVMFEGTGVTDYAFTAGDASSDAIYIATTSTQIWFKVVNVICTGTQPTGWYNNLHIVDCWRSGANAEVLVDNTSEGTSSSMTGSPSNAGGYVCAGGDWVAGNTLDGDIAELLLYRQKLTANERAELISHLSAKWNVTVS